MNSFLILKRPQRYALLYISNHNDISPFHHAYPAADTKNKLSLSCLEENAVGRCMIHKKTCGASEYVHPGPGYTSTILLKILKMMPHLNFAEASWPITWV